MTADGNAVVKDLTKDDVLMVVSAQSIGNIYWSFAELGMHKSDSMFKLLEKVIFEYIDEFNLQSLCNIYHARLTKLNNKKNIQ